MPVARQFEGQSPGQRQFPLWKPPWQKPGNGEQVEGDGQSTGHEHPLTHACPPGPLELPHLCWQMVGEGSQVEGEGQSAGQVQGSWHPPPGLVVPVGQAPLLHCGSVDETQVEGHPGGQEQEPVSPNEQ